MEILLEPTSNKLLVGDLQDSTLIALITKVAQPNNVTEFKPIACCNGRSIQDNILLTYELLKGYSSKGGLKRCSLKIDIAKAYDTVSWEF
nr:hypothetical protein [Tanacetum cinerariifolium]